MATKTQAPKSVEYEYETIAADAPEKRLAKFLSKYDGNTILARVSGKEGKSKVEGTEILGFNVPDGTKAAKALAGVKSQYETAIRENDDWKSVKGLTLEWENYPPEEVEQEEEVEEEQEEDGDVEGTGDDEEEEEEEAKPRAKKPAPKTTEKPKGKKVEEKPKAKKPATAPGKKPAKAEESEEKGKARKADDAQTKQVLKALAALDPDDAETFDTVVNFKNWQAALELDDEMSKGTRVKVTSSAKYGEILRKCAVGRLGHFVESVSGLTSKKAVKALSTAMYELLDRIYRSEEELDIDATVELLGGIVEVEEASE
jgi:hypothetical protein